MSSIRQLAYNDFTADSLLDASGEIVEIEFDSPEGEPIEPLVSEYPYNQKKYEGSVTYEEPVPGGQFSLDPEHYRFEYRDGSGLLVIDSDISGTKSRTIFKEINKELSREVGRFNQPQTYRLGLWSFAFASKDQPKIIARDLQEKQRTWDELSDLSQSEVVREYSLERADLVFYRGEERIDVSYENGRLNFTNSTKEGREYVIQLFEKHAISGEVLESLSD